MTSLLDEQYAFLMGYTYTPRYSVQVQVARSGETFFREHLATDDKEFAQGEKAGLESDGRTVEVIDRALASKPGTASGRRARSYYGLPFKGGLDQLEAHMSGVIARLADEATDRHLERCNQLEAKSATGGHHSLAIQIANNRLLKELRSRD